MNEDYLVNTCGVNLFHNFGTYYAVKKPTLGGAKLACAGFVDTPECRAAYTKLARKFNIVYQSSVRKNSYSGNEFFFVVYDGKRN